jgi:tetrathionate reductase subunit B
MYIKKGALGIEPTGGELGPNSRYYGKKKDMDLLFSNHTPELADMTQVRRRAMLASMVKPAMKTVKNLGLLGIVGAMIANQSTDSGSQE